MADNPNNQYVPKIAITKVLQAIRTILGDVSPAGIEAVGNFISGGGQTIESALFELDNAITPTLELLVTCDTPDSQHFIKNNITQNDITKDDIATAFENKYNVKIIYRINDRNITLYSSAVTLRYDSSTYLLCCDFFQHVADDGIQNIHHLRIEVADESYEVFSTEQEHVYSPDSLMTGTGSIGFSYDATQYLNGEGEFTNIPVLAIKVEDPLCDTPYNTIKQAIANGYIITVNGRLVTSWNEYSNYIELFCRYLDSNGLVASEESYVITTSGQTQSGGGYFSIGPTKTSQLTNDSGFIIKTPVQVITTDAMSYTLTPEWNKIYKLHNTVDFYSLTSLTINTPENAMREDNFAHEEILIEFNCGADDMTLTVPSNLVWANDEAPTFKQGMRYQLSINKYVDKDNNTILMAVCVGFNCVL